MKPLAFVLTTALLLAANAVAEPTNVAEDDASHSAYGTAWENGKNGGSGFGPWALTSEGSGADRHSGFFIADTKNNQDLLGAAKNDKAFGVYANGTEFEQAVAYRSFEKPLQVGDSFSFMMENGQFEKKFDKEEQPPGSIGLVLRSSNANSSVADYNKDAVFEFGFYQGKGTYQIYEGSGDGADSGVVLDDSGVAVTVTITGAGTYDLEIQTLKDKKLTKMAGRKLKSGDPIQSFALFDRNGEKNDAFFNQFQVTREAK